MLMFVLGVCSALLICLCCMKKGGVDSEVKKANTRACTPLDDKRSHELSQRFKR